MGGEYDNLYVWERTQKRFVPFLYVLYTISTGESTNFIVEPQRGEGVWEVSIITTCTFGRFRIGVWLVL